MNTARERGCFILNLTSPKEQTRNNTKVFGWKIENVFRCCSHGGSEVHRLLATIATSPWFRVTLVHTRGRAVFETTALTKQFQIESVHLGVSTGVYYPHRVS